MRTDGIEALLANIEDCINDIDDDANEILQRNAVQYSADAKKTAKTVMNKGYWTGNLAAQIAAVRTGNLEWTVTSNAGYSGFLEFGTRYMSAEPFMWPVYQQIKQQIAKDFKELLNG